MTQARSIRLEKQLTLEQVAPKAGISVKTLQKFEKGQTVNQTTIEALADFYKVTTDHLLGRTDARK